MRDRQTVREAKVDASLTIHLPTQVDVKEEIDRRLAFISRHVDDVEINEAYTIEKY